MMRRLRRAMTLSIFALAASLVPATSDAQDISCIEWVADDDIVIEKIRELDAAITAERWEFVSRAAQALIDDVSWPGIADGAASETTGRRSVHLVPDPKEDGVFFSVREYVMRRLAGLPAAGLDAYRAVHAVGAAERFERARVAGDVATLKELAAKYRLTAGGQRALLRLAYRELETGNCAAAARWFEDLLAVAWTAETSEVRRTEAIAGLSLCYGVLGNRRLLAMLREECAGYSEDARRLDVAGAKTDIVDYIRSLEARLTTPTPFTWESAERLDVLWSTPPSPRSPTRLPKLDVRPKVEGDTVVFHARDVVRCVALVDGSARWTVSLGRKRDGNDRPLPGVFGMNLRSLDGARGNGFYVFVIEEDSGERRLAALDDGSGAVRWTRTLAIDGKTPLRLDPSPLIVDDALFVTATDGEANPNSWLLRLDLDSGVLRFAARIGGNSPLPFAVDRGDVPPVEHWIAALPGAYGSGLLHYCDNLGTIATIEASTGRPRHLFRYPRRSVESSSRFAQAQCERGFDSSPVILDEDRLIAAPDDAGEWYSIFLAPPGDREHRRRNENWLLADRGSRGSLRRLEAGDNGSLFFSGKDDITGEWCVLSLSPGNPERSFQWLAPLDSSPEGFLGTTPFGVYVCSQRYVYRIDRRSGSLIGPLASFEKEGVERLGALVPTSHGLLVGSERGVLCLGTKAE